MSQGLVVSDAFISEVDPVRCSFCGRCINICPFGAIDWNDRQEPAGGTRKTAMVNSAECKGCGLCVASCLSSAIHLKGFSDEQILAMVNSMIEVTV